MACCDSKDSPISLLLERWEGRESGKMPKGLFGESKKGDLLCRWVGGLLHVCLEISVGLIIVVLIAGFHIAHKS